MLRKKSIITYLLASLALIHPVLTVAKDQKKRSAFRQFKYDIGCALKGDARAKQWARIGIAAVGATIILAMGGTAVFYGLKARKKQENGNATLSNKPQTDYENLKTSWTEQIEFGGLSRDSKAIICNPKIELTLGNIEFYTKKRENYTHNFLKNRNLLIQCIRTVDSGLKSEGPGDFNQNYLNAYDKIDEEKNRYTPKIELCAQFFTITLVKENETTYKVSFDEK